MYFPRITRPGFLFVVRRIGFGGRALALALVYPFFEVAECFAKLEKFFLPILLGGLAAVAARPLFGFEVVFFCSVFLPLLAILRPVRR